MADDDFDRWVQENMPHLQAAINEPPAQEPAPAPAQAPAPAPAAGANGEEVDFDNMLAAFGEDQQQQAHPARVFDLANVPIPVDNRYHATPAQIHDVAQILHWASQPADPGAPVDPRFRATPAQIHDVEQILRGAERAIAAPPAAAQARQPDIPAAPPRQDQPAAPPQASAFRNQQPAVDDAGIDPRLLMMSNNNNNNNNNNDGQAAPEAQPQAGMSPRPPPGQYPRPPSANARRPTPPAAARNNENQAIHQPVPIRRPVSQASAQSDGSAAAAQPPRQYPAPQGDFQLNSPYVPAPNHNPMLQWGYQQPSMFSPMPHQPAIPAQPGWGHSQPNAYSPGPNYNAPAQQPPWGPNPHAHRHPVQNHYAVASPHQNQMPQQAMLNAWGQANAYQQPQQGQFYSQPGTPVAQNPLYPPPPNPYPGTPVQNQGYNPPHGQQQQQQQQQPQPQYAPGACSYPMPPPGPGTPVGNPYQAPQPGPAHNQFQQANAVPGPHPPLVSLMPNPNAPGQVPGAPRQKLSRIPKLAKGKGKGKGEFDYTKYYDELPKTPDSILNFEYNKYGEWKPFKKGFTKEQIWAYFQARKDQNLPLTIWIQNFPASCGSRGGPSDQTKKCRCEGCPEPSKTILKGFWRIAFDERPDTSGKPHDPFMNAGYMHLHCFEECFDLTAAMLSFNVQADIRHFDMEDRNPMSLTRDHASLLDTYNAWVAQDYDKYCAWHNSNQQRLADNLDALPRQPLRDHEHLWRHLTDQHLATESRARQKARTNRGGVSIDIHRGDLRLYVYMRDKRKEAAQKEKEEFNAYKEEASRAGSSKRKRDETEDEEDGEEGSTDESNGGENNGEVEEVEENEDDSDSSSVRRSRRIAQKRPEKRRRVEGSGSGSNGDPPVDPAMQ